jgi:hypothetical protein
MKTSIGTEFFNSLRRFRAGTHDRVPPKDRFFGLWKAEKERMSEQLARFSEERYATSLLSS